MSHSSVSRLLALTQMEVVVLCIADGDEEADNVDERCDESDHEPPIARAIAGCG